jgi:hypothetical protein
MNGSPTYVFGSDVPFTHFSMPAVDAETDHEFEVTFNGQTHTIFADTPFAFTDFVPGGVTKFYLSGIDASEQLNILAPAPFVHGFRFAEDGLASVVQAPILPGDYDLNGAVDAVDFGIWRNTFGSITDLRADGNHDGIVDAGDYDIWRKWQAIATPATGAAALSTVPEPNTFVIAATATIGLFVRRSRRRRNKLALVNRYYRASKHPFLITK